MLLILFVAWTVTTFLTKSPQNKKQKVATGLLLDKLRAQDFAGSLSGRTTRVLGPISRHRIADILPHMKRVSRASRPGLLVGFLRILCNGLCTAQRFHTAENDHTCRIGCPDEPDSLSHYSECPRLHNIFLSFWRHATMVPQRNSFLHDLIFGVFLRSLQYGIVVLGFLDAFVYAHHKHRRDSANAGNFGDCMSRSSVHDCHHSCLRPRVPDHLSWDALSRCPALLIPCSPAQVQIFFSSQ